MAATLSKANGTVICRYLTVVNNTATGGAEWFAGNSTDGGGNSGWTFGYPATGTGAGDRGAGGASRDRGSAATGRADNRGTRGVT